MDCVACGTCVLHLFHEPMSMGCRCRERICQRCVSIGNIQKCPTCRKVRAKPKVDRRMLQTYREQEAACLGCGQALLACRLHAHEKRCNRYRSHIDALFLEDVRARRRQADEDERRMSDMQWRMGVQQETIQELEEHIDDLEQSVAKQEDERRLYAAEQSEVLRQLDSLAGPLHTTFKRLELICLRFTKLRASVRRYRLMHQLSRRPRQTPPQPAPAPPAEPPQAEAGAGAEAEAEQQRPGRGENVEEGWERRHGDWRVSE